jgi:hypothetical protein
MEGPVFRPAQTKLEQTSRDAPPPGSLSGRVALDRPRQGLMDVRAFRVWTVQGERRLGGRDGGYEARFDYNTGEYEIPGLPPGDYVVVAMTQEVSSTTWSAADKARAAKMARTGVPLVPRTSPTFYPAAVEAEAAEIVTIAAGSDVRGIDVTPMGRQWALITGRVVDALNRPSPYAQVAIGLASLPAALEPMLRLQNSLSKPDGSFALTVPAGRYVLTSRGSGIAVAQPGATQRGLFAQTEITVSSVDIEDLVLRLEEGATIAGTLTVDSSSASRPNLGFWVGAFAEDVAAAVPAFMALVRPDGTFRIDGISPGRYSLRTTSQGWLTERVIVDGRSVVDAPLDLHQGQSISGVEIAITDRQTTLTCSVQDSAGAPITTYTLAIVPADPALRRTGSARMPKPDRPSVKDGRYTVTGLPPGDYLIFALSDHDEDAWAAGIRPSLDPASAVKVSLGIGDKKDVAVRLAGKAPGPGPKPEAHATR